MKKILPLFLLVSQFLFSNENLLPTWNVFQANYENTKWTLYSNGQNPQVDSYDLKLNISNQDYTRLLEASFARKENPEILTPDAFIHPGDEIEILQEGYSIENSDQSWFRLRHLQTMFEFDAKGPLLEYKPQIEDLDVAKISDLHIDKTASDFIYFKLEESYVKVPISSEKYHGFYDEMSFKILSSSPQNVDELGRYTIHYQVENPLTSEVFEWDSLMKDERKLLSSKIYASKIGYLHAPHYITLYRLKFVFDDGSEYLTTDVYKSHRLDSSLENWHRGQLGSSFEIIREEPTNIDGRRSVLTIKSTNSNELQIIGPARNALPVK